MSIEAMAWAVEAAPNVPSHLVGLLVAMGSHANKDGSGSRAAVDRLAYGARKKHRQTQNDIAKLLELGLIRYGDQSLVAHLPADRRPVVYDLAMERHRDPYVRPDRSDAAPRVTGCPQGDDAGCTTVHPAGPTGCTVVPNGVHCGTERGAAQCTQPVLEPSLNQNPPTPHDVDPSPADPDRAGTQGGVTPSRNRKTRKPRTGTRHPVDPQVHADAAAFVAGLPDALPLLPDLTRAGSARLVEQLAAAIGRGVTWAQVGEAIAPALPPHTFDAGKLLAGRMARLVSVEDTASQRPEHCGVCDPVTRIGVNADGVPCRCPNCHPLMV